MLLLKNLSKQKKSGDKDLLEEARAQSIKTGQALRKMGLSTNPGEATKQLNKGGYTSANNMPKKGQDKTYAPFGD